MKTYRVTFSELVRRQLFEIYDYIAEHADPVTALRYIQRIEAYCRGFSTIAERGTRRDDLRPGLRLVGFERRVTIATVVTGDQIVILQILYGGRNIDDLRLTPPLSEAVKAMSDAEVLRRAEADPDAGPTSAGFWEAVEP